MIRFKKLITLFTVFLVTPVWAQTMLDYTLSWKEPNSHYLHISAHLESASGTETQFRIPAWRPGRYVIQNYSKNVIDFEAVDGQGRALQVARENKDTWRVSHAAGAAVTVRYRYYAKRLDAGESYLDDIECYINPITSFVYIPGREMSPVSLRIQKPSDWRVATALHYNEGQDLYHSENYHEFVDSPILISGSFDYHTFPHGDTEVQIAIQGEGNYDSEKIVNDIRKIVVAQCELMQDQPTRPYLFMYHIVPYRFGHGVEHKNSTSIVRGPGDFTDESFYDSWLGVTSHEFFHYWLVERIRPAAMYYPDYSRENYTTTMWIYEGITSYYTGVTLVHAELRTPKKYLESLARSIRGYERSYGRKVLSTAEVSLESWNKSMGQAPPNTYYSFYTKGNLLGLMLDLKIRGESKNKKTLDDVMRYLNDNFAKKDMGVPENGFLEAINTVTGADFSQFFADYVDGTEMIDYNEFLVQAGLMLETEVDKKAPKVETGMRTRGDAKQAIIANVEPESPAFRAGLDQDDVLVAMDGVRAHQENLTTLLKKYNPGDVVNVTVFRRERLKEIKLTLGEARPGKYTIKVNDDRNGQQKKILKSWLRWDGEKAKE